MPRGNGSHDEFLSIMEPEWGVIEMESVVVTETIRATAPTTQEMVFADDVAEFVHLVGNSPTCIKIWKEWTP